MLTIAIFTRDKNEKLINLINDLKKQSFNDFQIKIYSDSYFDLDNIKIETTKGKNIAQKRNQAINECKSQYLFLLDDDNRIYNKDFLKKLFSFEEKINNNCIISPIIYWRDTDIVQSTGIRFCYILGKVFANKKLKGDFQEVKGIGGNSLFGKLENFKKAKFDENMGFIREDIDYSYSLQENGVKIYVVNEKINHQERDKTFAEKSFLLGKAYEKKVKNRNIFVKKHGNIFEKTAYWLIGYWLGLIYWKLIKTFKS